jgi:transposase-like protein
MGYSTERKQAVRHKLLLPYNRTVGDLAKEEGVSTGAIYQWRKAAWRAAETLRFGDPVYSSIGG